MYKLWDEYEGRYLVGTYYNTDDLRDGIREWIEDTDGESDLFIEIIDGDHIYREVSEMFPDMV